MLNTADLQRLVDKLDRPGDIKPPQFSPELRPARRHSRSGRDCTNASRAGLTKKVAFGGASGTTYACEGCPCGSLRQIVDGEPDRDWSSINRFFDDLAWAAATTPETTEDPSLPTPQTGVLR